MEELIMIRDKKTFNKKEIIMAIKTLKEEYGVAIRTIAERADVNSGTIYMAVREERPLPGKYVRRLTKTLKELIDEYEGEE